MTPTTEWYWYALLVLVTLVCIGWFLFRANQLIQLTRMGIDSKRFNNWGTRIKMLLVYVFGQFRMYSRKRYTAAGIAHFFTFWGFIFIQLSTLQLFLQGLFPGLKVPFLHDNPGWLLFLDLVEVWVLVAMVSFSGAGW